MKSDWMNRIALSLGLMACALFSSSTLSEDLGVTMRMVTSDEALTESVVREIELSRPVMLDARPGPDTAAEARENGRGFGQSVAEQAREAARSRKEGKFPKAGSDRSPGKPDQPGKPENPGNS